MLLTTPTFGEPLPITASPETLAFLGARRSASAMTLQAPGPNETELQTLLSIAARAPDQHWLAQDLMAGHATGFQVAGEGGEIPDILQKAAAEAGSVGGQGQGVAFAHGPILGWRRASRNG